MDVSKHWLLHQLIDPPFSDEGSESDFMTAMKNMKIESVFDIVRLSPEQFARALALHSSAEAQHIYDNAVNHARKISRLYQEHQLSLDDGKGRTRRSTDSGKAAASATYQGLFNENWDQFCHAEHIGAMNSPVAYLRALYLFAGQLESSSTRPEKVTLEQRRPDLKALMLDPQSAFVARPMLSLVNETLSTHIQQHLTKTSNTQSVQEVLASEHYPFSLPYDLYHQQCMLGLGRDKPALGELKYRVKYEVPFRQMGSANGGHSEINAQILLSGLSPEQQRILTAPPMTDIKALEKAYGTQHINQLESLDVFNERTGLTTDQVEQVFAQGKYRPRSSTQSPASSHPQYGASYINGPACDLKNLEVTGVDKSDQKIGNSSNERFDRLQRMIRLQRWTAIPVADLDTLVVSALRSEDNKAMTLNRNTLRVLGVYQYLNQRHRIAPEEFAALLHDLPTSTCGGGEPLFDRVFNRTGLLKNPMAKDPATTLEITDSNILNYLGAGLGLSVTPDSLLLYVKQANDHLSSLQHDLRTVSSLYRQARIAKLFGLSPIECTALARLLGGEKFCERLVTGKLSSSQEKATDILDVLMAMDWAVEWFKRNNYTAMQWCRWFDEKQDLLPLNRPLEERIKTLHANTNITHEEKVRRVESLLHDVANLTSEQLPWVMKLAGTSPAVIFEEADHSTFDSGKMPPLLAKVLRAAEAFQGLLLSNTSLQALLKNPTWLAYDNTGTMSPHTLYLLDRFSLCTHHHVQAETSLLHYLTFANENALTTPENEANAELAKLLNWSVEEVSHLTAILPFKRAQSMEEVDWVMRCQACANETGLPVSTLILAASLTADKPAADWKTVGEALIAARH